MSGAVLFLVVVSAGYAVLGRWRERYEDVDYRRAIDMLETLGAEHLVDRTYGTLSEGERERVLIARALPLQGASSRIATYCGLG